MYLKKSRKAGGGFTLTEAAIVLGIVGLILGAIWVAATSVYNNIRVKRTSEELLQIVQSIRSMHATTATVATGDITADLAKAGVFPADMLANATAIDPKDIWGGDVTVNGTNGGTTFDIVFGNVPKAACIDLLVRNTGQGRDTGLSSVKGTATESGFPVTVSNAVKACGDNDPVATVTFSFRLKG